MYRSKKKKKLCKKQVLWWLSTLRLSIGVLPSECRSDPLPTL